MANEINPQDGLSQADQTQNEFSRYQGAIGQAGERVFEAVRSTSYLGNPGDTIALTPGPDGFGKFYIGCAWNLQTKPITGFWQKLLHGPATTTKVDIDLGCLYELQDGTRGALQALGAENGALDRAPYIWLSHDERTGLAAGDDEHLIINGQAWTKFNRVLIYAYIYEGAPDWSDVRPSVTLRIPGQPQANITPQMSRSRLGVCALALIEHIRGGLKLTNLTEYFPGQPDMDRAYSFGVHWDDGAK
jgi:tellurite resistance protein TerA